MIYESTTLTMCLYTFIRKLYAAYKAFMASVLVLVELNTNRTLDVICKGQGLKTT